MTSLLRGVCSTAVLQLLPGSLFLNFIDQIENFWWLEKEIWVLRNSRRAEILKFHRCGYNFLPTHTNPANPPQFMSLVFIKTLTSPTCSRAVKSWHTFEFCCCCCCRCSPELFVFLLKLQISRFIVFHPTEFHIHRYLWSSKTRNSYNCNTINTSNSNNTNNNSNTSFCRQIVLFRSFLFQVIKILKRSVVCFFATKMWMLKNKLWKLPSHSKISSYTHLTLSEILPSNHTHFTHLYSCKLTYTHLEAHALKREYSYTQ